MFSPGAKIQHYEIIKLLGKGGMGEVYLAHDSVLDRKVALKFLPVEMQVNDIARARLLREAKSAAALDHPFICKVYEAGEVDRQAFIVMEFVEGQDLRSKIEEGPISLRDALQTSLEVAEALEYAHSKGIVHRDLKPANIMLTPQGHAKVMDFGLAKRVIPGGGAAELSRTLTQASITEQGSIAGTLAYMSPEQAKGENVDARSDIFSLGIILYEMLSGKHPFSKPSPIETVTSILRDAVPPAHITPKSINTALNPILQKALAKNPVDRYQNVADFTADLRKAQTGKGFRISFSPRLMLISAASVLIIAAVIFGVLRLRHPSRESAVKPAKTEQKPMSVLIADFENKTGDPVFDGALEQALGISLEGASFISMYNRAQARKLVSEIDPQANGKINAEAAQLLSSREGINVVINAAIEPNGTGYSIKVWAINPLTSEKLAEASKQIATKAEVLRAADGLAAELRAGLGGTPADSSWALYKETVTAASLEAMKIYSHAQDLTLSGKDDEAIPEYLRAIEKDPKLGRAYAGLAVIYRNRGQDEEANKYYEKAMALIDQLTDREKYRTRGGYYFLNRNYKKAIEEYTALRSQYPVDPAGHNNLPLAYFYNREMQKALEYGRSAVEFNRKKFTPQYNLVWYAIGAGRFDMAETEARRTLELNPEDEFTFVCLALIQLAGQDRPREAEKIYRELETKGPRGASLASVGLADLAMYEGRLKACREILEKGVALDLQNKFNDEATLKNVMIAQMLLLQGKTDPAAKAADQAVGSSKKGSVLFSAALVYGQAGQNEKALRLAEELNAKLQPELQAYARLIEGEVALKKGNIPEAVNLFHRSQELLDTWLSHMALGRAYLEAKEFAEAHSEFDMCLKRKGETTSIFLDDFPSYRYFAPLYYYLGRAQEGLKSPAGKESYQKFLKIKENTDPGDPLIDDTRKRLEAQ